MLDKRAFNYAAYDGIKKSELPAAIVFACIYVPLLVLYILRAIARPTYVFRVLCLFCIARIVAFVLRAIIAGNESAGDNINLVIAQMVIYNIGFTALLYSSYTLVLDRERMINPNANHGGGPLAIVMYILRERRLFRVACTVAIVLGVIGGIKQSDINNQSDLNLGDTLRKVSLYIFLVLVCILAIVTSLLMVEERNAGVWTWRNTQYGKKYGIVILLLISTLCIVREAYLTSTIGDMAKQNRAALFYPLVASTELICVILFVTPGLVPTRAELAAESEVEKHANISEIPLRPHYHNGQVV